MSFLGIKTRKVKQYSYTPRYYNERKERLKEIENRHREVSDEEYLNGFRRNPSLLRGSTGSLFDRKPVRSNNTTIRLVLIIGVLTVLVYFMLGGLDFISIFQN